MNAVEAIERIYEAARVLRDVRSRLADDGWQALVESRTSQVPVNGLPRS